MMNEISSTSNSEYSSEERLSQLENVVRDIQNLVSQPRAAIHSEYEMGYRDAMFKIIDQIRGV